jgi:hypothetical protein
MIVTDYTKIPIMAKENRIRMVYAADYQVLTTGTTQFSERGFVPFYSCSWFNSLRGESALTRNKQIVRRGLRCGSAASNVSPTDIGLDYRWSNRKKHRNNCLRWIAGAAKMARSVTPIGDCLHSITPIGDCLRSITPIGDCLRSIYDADPALMERNLDQLYCGLGIERFVGKTWIRRFDGGRITDDQVRILDIPMFNNRIGPKNAT